MGQVECDDGNNIDGDGCSKECMKEPGFLCLTNANGRDVCRDIVAPTATLKVKTRNELIVQFTEPVLFFVNGTYTSTQTMI